MDWYFFFCHNSDVHVCFYKFHFLTRLDGISTAVWIHVCPNNMLNGTRMSTIIKGTSNWRGPIANTWSTSPATTLLEPSNALTIIKCSLMKDRSTLKRSILIRGHTFKVDLLSLRTQSKLFLCIPQLYVKI